MLEKIHIFHTNDLHSHFEYWLRMQAFVKQQRQLFAAKGEASFLMDIGDHMDRSHIYTDATLGKGNVQLLNEAQYDVVTIGNNEGITLAFEDLYTLYEDATFDVVVGNLQAQEGKNPQWMKPYTILTTATGTKIGVIAATAPFELFYETLQWRVVDPHETLMAHALALRGQVDILVCLSHLGITEDELLAQQCPVIDVIFGSHTHHYLPEGKWVGDVLLTGGGKFGQYVGHLTIAYDHAQKKMVQLADEMIENASLAEIAGEAQFLYALSQQAIEQLSEPVVTLSKTYTKEWFHSSPVADLFAEALFDFTQADCVMFNAGIFMDALKKGHVSAYTMHNLLPHPINVCTLELSGAELMEVYRMAQNEEWPEMQLKGLGFRGVVFGKILFYHVKMTKQQELLLNGERVNPEKQYKLATLDLFTFGYFFPIFKHVKKHYVLPMFIRDLFLSYLEKKI